MEKITKSVAAIHDLSCFGRSSLTVVMPLLAKMNIQCCPLPTALLSTHGAFLERTYLDLTKDMVSIIKHWDTLNIQFDGIYSGFLGSSAQIDIVLDFINKFKSTKPLVVVDPVMGDNGKVYSIIDNSITKKMVNLVAKADVITPNITEASILLDYKYKAFYSKKEILDTLKELSNLGPKIVVLTSIVFKDNPKKFTGVYSKDTGELLIDSCKYFPVDFPGTGDAFTTIFLGALLKGNSLKIALKLSLTFIESAIETTIKRNTNPKEGIILEVPIALS